MTPDADLTLPPATADADATLPPGDPPTATGSAAAAVRALNTDPDATVGPRTAHAPVVVEAPPGFVIKRELGVGGMGVVYLARQVGLNRPVALKLVKGTRVDSKAVIRFLAEAEAVAAIKHPHVVEVYQYGEHQGHPYMALEFCPGGDLTSLSKAEQVRDAAWFRRAADLMAQVADGVNAAHALGIVHRDLKPHNVFLTADGTPKVADFGLAKRGLGSDLTHTQDVLGTPAYMAPEQAGKGSKFVGPEADVWALGVMLYELCCGELPIDTSGNLLDTLVRVAMGEVSQLRAKLPAVPPDLSLIAHKCLSPDPRDRYPTAGGLASDLRHWLDGKPISARPAGVVEQAVKWAKRNKKLAGMGLAVLLTMATATGVSLGFGLEANSQAGAARREKKNAEDAVERATTAEGDAKKKAEVLVGELKESRRVLDLARVREAETAIARNAMQAARDKLAAVSPENRCIAWGLLNRRCDGGDLTLRGHTGGVTSVAFSPDGRYLVSGSNDNTAWVWDAVTGEPLVELKGHTRGVNGVAYSPDGGRIVTGSSDETARVWDAATGRVLFEFKGHTSDGEERLNNGQVVLKKHTGAVNCVAFSPDGTRVATGSADKTARVWDASSGKVLVEMRGFTFGNSGELPVTGLAFSPDGNRLLVGADPYPHLRDTTTGQRLVEAERPHGVTDLRVAYSPDGRRFASAGNGEAVVWDAVTGKKLVEMTAEPKTPVRGLAVSPDGRQVLVGSLDGKARVWDAAGGKLVTELVGHEQAVNAVAFSPDGRRVATASDDGSVRVWDAASGQASVAFKGHTSFLECVAFSPDGRRVATASRDGSVRVCDAATGRTGRVLVMKGERLEVYSVAFSPDGRRIAAGGGDLGKTGRAVIWDGGTGEVLLELTGHTNLVRWVGFTPDGKRVITASVDDTVRVWDAATGVPGPVITAGAVLFGTTLSPDGTRVVTGGSDHSVEVWQVETGRKLLELKARPDRVANHSVLAGVSQLAYSPDGRRVIAGLADKTALVWDAVTGDPLVTLAGHAGQVSSVAYSPDGKRVLTGATDRTARVWDAATGQSLIELTGHTGDVSSVGFSPDGRRIVTASHDNTARVWEADMTEHQPGDTVSAEELARRRAISRPDPERHTKLATEYKADVFASTVQKSLEQQARGRLAVEAGDFERAWGHFIAAELIRPKPEPPRERLPPPRGAE